MLHWTLLLISWPAVQKIKVVGVRLFIRYLESGQPSKLLYRQVADLVHSRKVDRIIGVGEEISAAASRFEIDKRFFRTTTELIESGILSSLRNEVVLIKGARVFHFDDITDLLELKVHETILEINLEALVDNLNYYRNKLKQMQNGMYG